MISISYLEKLCVILDDPNTENFLQLRILKSLNNWPPIKNHIIASKIGKCIYRHSKQNNEIGNQFKNLVNKWKSILIDNNNDNQCKIETGGKKREKTEIKTEKIKHEPPKKKALSLKDYYKRNPDIIPENKVVKRFDGGFNSESGVSFIDSITVKMDSSKTKLRGPLKKSELNYVTSNQSVSQRIDIIKSRHSIISDNTVEIEDLTNDLFKQIPCMPQNYNNRKKVLQSEEAIVKYFPCNITEPPSLLKQCQTVLFNYRIYIEDVLWTPRELLIHILKAFTPEQLLNFESFNPQFIEDDEDLWKEHFMNKNRNMKKENNNNRESWRESYLGIYFDYETKIQQSITTMKSRMNDIRKIDQSKKIKVMTAPSSNPSVRRFIYRDSRDSHLSPATKKLRRQYKQLFSHLR